MRKRVCDCCNQYRDMYSEDNGLNIEYCVCTSCHHENVKLVEASRELNTLKAGDFAYNPKTQECYFIRSIEDGWMVCKVINFNWPVSDYFIYEKHPLIKLDLGDFLEKKEEAKVWYGYLTKWPTVPNNISGRRIVVEKKGNLYGLEIENSDGGFNIFKPGSKQKVVKILSYFEDQYGYEVVFNEQDACDELYDEVEI